MSEDQSNENNPKDPSPDANSPSSEVPNEMPSIAQLLQRKVRSPTSTSKKPKPEGRQAAPPKPAAQKTKASSGATGESHVKIQPQSRKEVRPQSLEIWETGMMDQSTDPVAQALKIFFDQGARSVLYLTMTPNPPTTIPLFVSSATLLPGMRLETWTGMKWDPTLTPEVWNDLLKEGFLEYSPPADSTVATSPRNVLRAAFGLEPNEWLLLTGVGPQPYFRGILALLSEESLAGILKDTAAFLSAPLPQNSKLQK